MRSATFKSLSAETIGSVEDDVSDAADGDAESRAPIPASIRSCIPEYTAPRSLCPSLCPSEMARVAASSASSRRPRRESAWHSSRHARACAGSSFTASSHALAVSAKSSWWKWNVASQKWRSASSRRSCSRRAASLFACSLLATALGLRAMGSAGMLAPHPMVAANLGGSDRKRRRNG